MEVLWIARPAPLTMKDKIRADIEQSRAALSDDVTALADKVDPRTRAKQAISNVKNKTMSKTSQMKTPAPDKARQAGQAVRANPKPTALTALVLAGSAVAFFPNRRRTNKATTRGGSSR